MVVVVTVVVTSMVVVFVVVVVESVVVVLDVVGSAVVDMDTGRVVDACVVVEKGGVVAQMLQPLQSPHCSVSISQLAYENNRIHMCDCVSLQTQCVRHSLTAGKMQFCCNNLTHHPFRHGGCLLVARY